MTENELSYLRRRVETLTAENETLRQGQQSVPWADSAGRWSQAVVKLISDLCNEVVELKRRVDEISDSQHGLNRGEHT